MGAASWLDRRESAWLLLAIAICAVYWNSLRAPFLFDDRLSIVENPTIRTWAAAFQPPRDSGITVSGRPLLNATFAVNHALGGLDVWGYHATNLAIHLLASGLLYEIIRRTLALPVFQGRFEGTGSQTALAASLLWALHPLQTESVTYVVQRAESLAGLWVLLAICLFLMAAERDGVSRKFLLLASSGVCLLGVATKESAGVAPLLLFAYDRCFLSGSFKNALLKHWKYYAALGVSSIALAFFILQTGNRGGTAGWNLLGYWWPYALTQCEAVTRYIGLIFWPHPLVFDYGEHLVWNPWQIVPQAMFLGSLVVAMAVLLWRLPPAGFCLFWFFVLLAPTSTVIPVITHTSAEHRLYVALAGPVVLAVSGLFLFLKGKAWPVCLLAIALLGTTTVLRNRDYCDEIVIWSDTARKNPSNGRAFNNLANAWERKGNTAEAEKNFREALRLEPQSYLAHYNYALLLAKSGRPVEAYEHFVSALDLKPEAREAWYGLGNVHLMGGELRSAEGCFLRSLALDSEQAEVHNSLGIVYASQSRPTEAAAEFAKALKIRPDYADAAKNLALLQGSYQK